MSNKLPYTSLTLLKNNDKKELTDLGWINEFYEYLQGNYDKDKISFARGHEVRLTKNKAYAIIWYLQEVFPLLPDTIEQCSVCGDLYDSNSEGYHSESNGKFYCDPCYPYELAQKEERREEGEYKRLTKHK